MLTGGNAEAEAQGGALRAGCPPPRPAPALLRLPLQVALEALQAARTHVAERKQLLNPLNHPLVKQFREGTHK